MKFSGKTFAAILGLVLVLAASLSAFANTKAQTTQEQIDQLLADYQKALAFELEHGQTVEVDDPDTGKTRVLTGESLAKIEALWDETQRQINELVARPEEERAKVVQFIQAIEPGEVTYLRQSSIPYYDADAKVEKYVSEKNSYTVDIATGQIIEIIPLQIIQELSESGESYNDSKPQYSQSELEQKARELIALVAGMDLNDLTPNFGTKQIDNRESQNYFFRWEDTTVKLNSGMTPFIQVGFSSNGELLNYVNILPFFRPVSPESMNQPEGLFPTVFNQVYANNGAYWTKTGTMSTKSNAGWCYLNRVQNPSLCPSSLWNFRYQFENYTWNVEGRWWPASNSNVESSAFIPNTNADAVATYTQ